MDSQNNTNHTNKINTDEIEEIEKTKIKKLESKITTHKKLLKKLHIAYKDLEIKEFINNPKIKCKLFLVVDNCEHLTKTFDFDHFYEQFKALNVNVIKRGLPIGDYAFILRI